MLVDLFNAELSPERYWQGPRSQKSGEGERERDGGGPGFESRQERQENFLLQGQLSVLILISVSVPPP